MRPRGGDRRFRSAAFHTTRSYSRSGPFSFIRSFEKTQYLESAHGTKNKPLWDPDMRMSSLRSIQIKPAEPGHWSWECDTVTALTRKAGKRVKALIHSGWGANRLSQGDECHEKSKKPTASGAVPGRLVSGSIGSGKLTGQRTAETFPGDSVKMPMATGSLRGKRESAGELLKTGSQH